MDYLKILSALSLPLGILILLLLICRSLVLWYFKIPDMIERQDQLIKVIQKQNTLMAKHWNLSKSETEEKEEEEEKKEPSFTELRYGRH